MNIAARIASVLLLAAPLTGVPAESPQETSVPSLRLQWQDPGSLQFDSLRTFPSNETTLLGMFRYQPAFSNFQASSPNKLFDSGYMTLQRSADGRVHYQLAVPNPLGAGVGGQLNTNSARFTLTWPRKN